jgi:hypothetical protein
MENNNTKENFAAQETSTAVQEATAAQLNEFDDIKLRSHQLKEEIAAWHIVESFFTAVERQMLQLSTLTFDIEQIKPYLQEMEKSQGLSTKAFSEIEFLLKRKINNWRYLLAERDKTIETYHLRRFCESLDSPLDAKFFVALTRFYRSLPHSPMVQSKYDFAVTRLYSFAENKTKRQLRLNREELVKELNKLFGSWDGETATVSEEISPEIAQEIAKIDNFIFEADHLKTFEEIVKSNLFDRLRICKHGLGEKFYETQITAVAVECNIVIGNIFANLLAETNENVSVKLLPEIDFAEIFHDVSVNAGQQTSLTLQEIRSNAINPENKSAGNVKQVLEWLRIIGLDSELEAEQTDESEIVTKLADVPVAPVLETLASVAPDKKIIENYLQNSEILRSLNFNAFLDSSESDLCREVLSVILQAEDIRRKELFKTENPNIDAHSEVTKLIQQSAFLAKQLQMKIPTADKETQNVLLIASNQLLETRLRLERAIVEYSRSYLENTETNPEPEEEQIIVVPYKKAASPPPMQKIRRKPVNRRLIAAAVLAVIFAIAAYSSISFFSPVVTKAKDVEVFNVKKLPGGDFWKTAHRQSGTLFITASDSWKKLSFEAQRNNLENLLEYSSTIKVEAVVITDGTGQPLGSASADGIQTMKEVGFSNGQ